MKQLASAIAFILACCIGATAYADTKQGNTTFVGYARVNAPVNSADAVPLTYLSTNFRGVLSLRVDYYVNATTGNDANVCSVGSPCATVSHVTDLLMSLYNRVDAVVTINIAQTGTAVYTLGNFGPMPLGSHGKIYFIGSNDTVLLATQTATSGSTTSTVVSGGAYTADAYRKKGLVCDTATNAANVGVRRHVSTNTSTTFVPADGWPAAVSAGDTFRVVEPAATLDWNSGNAVFYGIRGGFPSSIGPIASTQPDAGIYFYNLKFTSTARLANTQAYLFGVESAGSVQALGAAMVNAGVSSLSDAVLGGGAAGLNGYGLSGAGSLSVRSGGLFGGVVVMDSAVTVSSLGALASAGATIFGGSLYGGATIAGPSNGLVIGQAGSNHTPVYVTVTGAGVSANDGGFVQLLNAIFSTTQTAVVATRGGNVTVNGTGANGVTGGSTGGSFYGVDVSKGGRANFQTALALTGGTSSNDVNIDGAITADASYGAGTQATSQSASAASLAVGSTSISSGANTRILYQAGGVLQQNSGLVWNASNHLVLGGSGFNTTIALLDTGSASQQIGAVMEETGTGAGANPWFGTASGNYGIYGYTHGTSSGLNVGQAGTADGASLNAGLIGDGSAATSGKNYYGAIGIGKAGVGGGKIAALAGILRSGTPTTLPTPVAAALYLDNGGTALPVVVAQCNGTACWTLDGSGNVTGTGTLTVGSTGTALGAAYSATGTVGNGGGNILATSCITSTITVTGATTGDVVNLGPPAALEAGLSSTGLVSSANTVQVELCNSTALAIASANRTWRAEVRHY